VQIAVLTFSAFGVALLFPGGASAQEAHQEPFIDTASVSCGRVNRGGLAAAAELELEGPGFVIPEPWRTRGLRYGTQELVELIRQAAAAVERAHPGARLGVADLSRPQGGSAPNHRSHQAGRDVDLIYYALDHQGKPVAPERCMPSYGPDRRASTCHYPEERQVTPRRFDVKRNWALVKALLTHQQSRVRAIFVSLGIRNWLLEHAARVGESRALIRLATRTLMRPPRGRAPGAGVISSEEPSKGRAGAAGYGPGGPCPGRRELVHSRAGHGPGPGLQQRAGSPGRDEQNPLCPRSPGQGSGAPAGPGAQEEAPLAPDAGADTVLREAPWTWC